MSIDEFKGAILYSAYGRVKSEAKKNGASTKAKAQRKKKEEKTEQQQARSHGSNR